MAALRIEKVKEIITALTDESIDDQGDRLTRSKQIDATDDERWYALGVMTGCAARESTVALDLLDELHEAVVPKPLLNCTYRELEAIPVRGDAIRFMLDRLGYIWAAHPNKPLVDVLKSARRVEVAPVAAELHKAGFTDLDDWLSEDPT